ncbi:hypothetical protein ROHU_007975 [Labeo rohita]|uniref:Uncharacterized protein n=1 Tax=Labeo rohita TaxID=84645 RepID=A0A498MCA9_LABRO|nr:hypothetical protein ROHU_007975 [Labeo rohita]
MINNEGEAISHDAERRTTGRVSHVATMRSVIHRYQAGENSMSGRTGPNMKMLPKKLPRNRVTTKYRPLTDTIIPS